MAVRLKETIPAVKIYEVEIPKKGFWKYNWIEISHSSVFALLLLPVVYGPAFIYVYLDKYFFGIHLSYPTVALLIAFAFAILGCFFAALFMQKSSDRAKCLQEVLLSKHGWQGERPYHVVRSKE